MNIEESDYEKKKVLRVINNTKQTELSLNTRLKNTYAVLDSQRIFRRWPEHTAVAGCRVECRLSM